MINIIIKTNIFNKEEIVFELLYEVGKPTSSYVEDALSQLELTKMDRARIFSQYEPRVLLNLSAIDIKNDKTSAPENNDTIRILFYPKIPAIVVAAFWALNIGIYAPTWVIYGLTILINAVLLTGVSLLSMLLAKPSIPTPNTSELGDSNTYTWDGPQTSYATGKPIPLIYGAPYVAGDVISAQLVGVGKEYERDWYSIENRLVKSSPVDDTWLSTSNPAPTPPSGTPSFRINLQEEPRYNASIYRLSFQAYHRTWEEPEYPHRGGKSLGSFRLAKGPGFTTRGNTRTVVRTYIWMRTLDINGAPVAPNPTWTPVKELSHSAFDEPTKVYRTEISIGTKNSSGTPIYPDFFIYSKLSQKKFNSGVYYWCPPNLIDVEYFGFGKRDEEEEEYQNTYTTEAMQMVLALSDGVINEISDSFYINDVPVDNYGLRSRTEGSVQGIEIQRSKGYNVPYIDNLGSSYLLDMLGYKLLQSTPFDFYLEKETLTGSAGLTYETVNSNVEGFNITIEFPQGIYQIVDGNDKAVSARFWVRYRPWEDSDWGQWRYISDDQEEDSLTEATLQVREKVIGKLEINIKKGSAGDVLTPTQYQIQIVRENTVITDVTKGWSEAKVSRIQEFSFSRQTYPNTSIIALRIIPTDKLSGSMPNFNFPLAGRYIKVPVLRNSSNNVIPFELSFTEYNDGTQSYDWYYYDVGGIKQSLTIDTTATLKQYTSCIPFIVYDLLTTQDLHPNVSEDDLVWQDFIDAAEICWEMIAKDKTAYEYEHRFECDIAIDTKIDASTLIGQLIGLMRGKPYWIGNKFRLLIMKPENMTQVFTDADIIPDSYQEQYISDSKIPNTLEVSYYDKNERFKQRTVQISNKDASYYKNKVRKQSVSLVGASRLSQVLRSAKYILNYSLTADRIIQFKTTSALLASIPGNVIGVQSNVITYIYGGFFRQESYTDAGETTFYLDQSLTLSTGTTYIFKIQRRTGATAGIPSDEDEYQITVPLSGSYDYITISETISPNYAANDTWILTVIGAEAETYVKKVRIGHITRDPKKDEYTVICEPYNKDIYDDYATNVEGYLPPVVVPDLQFTPVDVTRLTAAQLFATYDVNVTYTIPAADAPIFTGRISVATSNSITYTSDDDVQLTTTRPILIYSSSGSYRGIIYIDKLNKTAKTFNYIQSDNFIGTITVGDFLIQKREGAYLQVQHVEIYISENGRDYQFYGIDSSKGRGYIIKSLRPNITYWISAHSVAVTGTKGLNPPVTTIKMGLTQCLPTPTHLSLCGQGDGSSYFIECDACISWTQSAVFEGAGQGIETYAGDEAAGVTNSYNITGYNVWVYDNAGSSPQFLREIGVKDTEFKYTHQMNIEDQYNVFARQNKGQRSLFFRVYQEDSDGNISCEPAELAVENLAPSMAGFYPTVRAYAGGIIEVNWEAYVNDPAQYSTDILGYQVWYGTQSTDMSFIDVPAIDGEARTRITGLNAGTYYIYIVPYDCFGTGSAADRSGLRSVTIQGQILPPYIPERPDGVTGSLEIESYSIGATSYEIIAASGVDLESYGFVRIEDPSNPVLEYSSTDYHWNHLYYNTDENLSGYCCVTGSSLNTSNWITALYFNTSLNRWIIRVNKPPSGVLSTYGYTDADGVPQIGQKFAINAWAELSYDGTTIWGGGLNSTIHVRWWSADPAVNNVDRISHYTLGIYKHLGALSYTHLEPADKTLPVGNYYDVDITKVVAAESVDLSLRLVSDTGNASTALTANDVKVIKETADLMEASITVSWSVASTADGSDIQVAIDNWDELWQDKRIKEFEVYASLRQWDFTGSDWETDPVQDFQDLKDLGDMDVLRYKEFRRTVSGHERIVNEDALGVDYFFLGATDGPIFHWVNSAVSDEGAICTHYSSGPPESCAQGCVIEDGDLLTGNCPYGLADSNGTCCYPNNYYTPDSSGESSRTAENINYNRYFVAIAFRLVTGRRVWVLDGAGDLDWKDADFELIDRMHIKDASITTAKIGDAMINNAKVKHLSAGKVWIGDYPALEPWRPFTGHCAYDMGSYCQQGFGAGVYKETPCPRGDPGCGQYTESLFFIERVFGMADHVRNSPNEYTYINGGMILTDSILAKSIQVGALTYTIDLQVDRVFDATVEPQNVVKIQWHKGGDYNEGGALINGRIEFANGWGRYITADTKTFTALGGELPDGTSIKRIMHIAYVDGVNLPEPLTILWRQIDLDETVSNFPYDNTFSNMRSEGELPLFTVTIVNSMLTSYSHAEIAGRNLANPEDIIKSDWGQYKVDIVMIAPSPGTYIRNNDITTGVIHNEYWTSYFDMRMYTGMVASDNYRGHGRIIIDGPSSLYDRGVMSSHGDEYGVEWWNYNATWPGDGYGTDTKLLIGRPYVDGLETALTGISDRETAENAGDAGYLWFYRQYDTGIAKWVGQLEVGGRLRVKDLSNKTDLMVGQKYEEVLSAWRRTNTNEINFYDITALLDGLTPNDPQQLVKLGDYFEFRIYDGDTTDDEQKRLIFGGSYTDILMSDFRRDGALVLYDTSSLGSGTPYARAIMKFGAELDTAVAVSYDNYTTHYLREGIEFNGVDWIRQYYTTLCITYGVDLDIGDPQVFGNISGYVSGDETALFIVPPPRVGPITYQGPAGIRVYTPHDDAGNDLGSEFGIHIAGEFLYPLRVEKMGGDDTCLGIYVHGEVDPGETTGFGYTLDLHYDYNGADSIDGAGVRISSVGCDNVDRDDSAQIRIQGDSYLFTPPTGGTPGTYTSMRIKFANNGEIYIKAGGGAWRRIQTV